MRDIMGMMQKAQEFQQKAQEIQAEAAATVVEGNAGAGMVVVSMTARATFRA